MAKLYLKYEQAVLKEVTLSQGVLTIGRLPDNGVQIDNLAVSGHHAKLWWETDHYVIEDNNSLNGTYVNNAKISRYALKDGDLILIGKHTLAFKDEWQAVIPKAAAAKGPAPQLEQTMVLDTKRMKEMLANSPLPAAPPPTPATAPAAATPRSTSESAGSSPTHQYSSPTLPPPERVGLLTIITGKTDQERYLLTSKMSVIGKSSMASIKLKGWFKPKMAALISKRETGYFIAASEKDTKVKINGEEIAGQRSLADGDLIEVAGVKMTFGFQE
jgi:pSer/pThr/pTyr-binding forkhead associated (FHA) protein